ncbi:unnamed protein product [Rotaria sp. Silwood2]|nr:unnamed protein product [Rotaria sp. Silwood2]CAF4235328.1 unnamed protein product [Rotaria sp. Silwood2]
MGTSTSIEEKKEVSILRRPKQGEASDLYWACRNGDIDTVQKIIASNTYIDINCLEPNGSTALHAASFFGHTDIVRLLLHQCGVIRHRRNRHGLTAYDEAATDEIRQLFRRSSNSQRFCSDTTTDAEHLFTLTADEQTEDDDDNDKAPNDWVDGENDEEKIHFQRYVCHIAKTMASSSTLRPLFRRIIRDKDDFNQIYNESTAAEALQRLIDEHITPSHSEYQKACELVSKYVKTKNVEHLLRLYSLETPFYKNLGMGQGNHCLLIPLLFKLDGLIKRAYQGRSFRGLNMTRQDLRAYQWALKHKGSILITDSFCSTSVDQDVACRFIDTSSPDTIPVLMVFNFSEKCDTAIQLFRFSDTLLSISDFEDEHEVLVLPMTLFHVTDIEVDKANGQHTIYLENVPTKGELFTSLQLLWKHRE